MRRAKLLVLFILSAIAFSPLAAYSSPPAAPLPSPTPHVIPPDRVASIYISQSFINEQLAAHLKSTYVRGLNIELDPAHTQLLFRGLINIPIEEMRAINLDPRLGRYRFQLAVHLQATKKGYLILEFPLNETYFYPADSKDPAHERIIIPVQMLSVALASVRGYLAALSGDFTGFDRRTAKVTALINALDRSIKTEKNPDALDDLRTQRESLRLQLEAVPIERKQLRTMSKEVESMLGFTGEKELNLNNELAAKKNALVFKIRLSELTPYLKDVDLGGVRILHDKKDGDGENFLAIDVTADLDGPPRAALVSVPKDRPVMKTAPSLIIRLRQSMFESKAITEAEQQQMGSNLKDFQVQLKDDGLHVSGRWKTFLFLSVPFDTVVDFTSAETDTFEARVRKMDVAGIDLEFLSKFVLEALRKRLDQTLKGICTFEEIAEGGKVRALRVTVNPKALVPAFPNLHLLGVDIREREFLLKVGRTDL